MYDPTESKRFPGRIYHIVSKEPESNYLELVNNRIDAVCVQPQYPSLHTICHGRRIKSIRNIIIIVNINSAAMRDRLTITIVFARSLRNRNARIVSSDCGARLVFRRFLFYQIIF